MIHGHIKNYLWHYILLLLNIYQSSINAKCHIKNSTSAFRVSVVRNVGLLKIIIIRTNISLIFS